LSFALQHSAFRVQAIAMTLPDHVTIRPATPLDLEAIVTLWMAMMREHESFDSRVRLADKADNAYRQYLRYYIAEIEAAVFVAENGAEVIGYCLAYPARNLPMFLPSQYGYLSDLTVSQPWRGRGIGGALLEAVRRWFRERGIGHIQLQVYDRNASGLAFWRKEGFSELVHGLWQSAEDGPAKLP
jgi:ribosomal protein S18 acetylase RimI-like enzyme